MTHCVLDKCYRVWKSHAQVFGAPNFLLISIILYCENLLLIIILYCENLLLSIILYCENLLLSNFLRKADSLPSNSLCILLVQISHPSWARFKFSWHPKSKVNKYKHSRDGRPFKTYPPHPRLIFKGDSMVYTIFLFLCQGWDHMMFPLSSNILISVHVLKPLNFQWITH